MARFVGRQKELARLIETTREPAASFIVVKGRRRVGKSRLIEEFSHRFDHYYVFTGLAPDKEATAAHQLMEFSRQMARQFKTARAMYEDWSDAFWAVAQRNRRKPTSSGCASRGAGSWSRSSISSSRTLRIAAVE